MKGLRTHRKLRIALWSVAIVVILTLLGGVILIVMARWAISDYRGDATTQLNDVIAGKTTGVPVQLRGVLLGETLSGDYRQIKALDNEYQILLTDTKSYVAALDAHNALVEQYNAGIKGEKPLGGDLLKSVNKYKAVIENRFPGEADRARAIGELLTKITSSTEFDTVSGDIDTILQSGDQFLTELRESLNTRITEFQKKVN
ncbi:hypothetical protein FWH58_00335 [Candidatus Saccharibacteria bacterium]|nr:hypothetical protein [Candidatus Saccharibacteria bacterium]